MRIKVARQEDAQKIVDTVTDLMITYGNVTVYDVNVLIGIPGSFADTKFGWTEDFGIDVWVGRSGVHLTFPEPVRI